ncbi:predicted protein [Candida tropicalis MYA-3404]|uniref:RING-type E3 ubiquitin transferase n=1 Tax=Candida tropicalis (strain ATCC MYA-3404 / T1) TaxID=294747 RepID=C5MCE2_CANTT|nr:predicted protein [Candida tropicalis MYA-3404]EER32222.1 predicted protein [Candida tropicalis MYA-3404]KAG4405822.1 hypothetical protein JTP64_004693 [Candida tropicalis]
MFSQFKNVFHSAPQQPKLAPRGQQVKGDYKMLVPYVENDINQTKILLKKYQRHPLFNKLFQLMESNHINEKQHIEKTHKQKHLEEYYANLFTLLKRHLEEYSNLLDTFQNNYVHSLYEDNLMNYKISKSSRSNSVFSSNPSLAASVQETERSSLELDDDEEAPEYLLDPISFELFTDPVITPSGITYEKSHLLDHLKNRGKFDPITRQELTEDQLYPNLIMKDTIEAYRKETRA